jgi:hypothetical protein
MVRAFADSTALVPLRIHASGNVASTKAMLFWAFTFKGLMTITF